ncbi:MAG: mechanosensitive ion channel family protein [Acidobacteriaceae bacterium]
MNYSTTIANSLQDLFNRIAEFLPNFIVAVIVLVVGWIIAVALAKLVKAGLMSAKVDEVGDKLGLQQVSARTGMKMTISGLIAWIIKWFLIVALFLAAADILGLTQISAFLNQVLLYIPNVVAAAAILLIGALLGRFLSRLVRHSVAAAALHSADMLGTVTYWAVMVFAILAAMDQLGVAQAFIQTLFTGIIIMIAIAGGLAFGLGGREHASKVLDRIEKDIKS